MAHPLVEHHGERVVGGTGDRLERIGLVEPRVHAGLGVDRRRIDGTAVGERGAGGDQVGVDEHRQIASQRVDVADADREVARERPLELHVGEDRVLRREVTGDGHDALGGQREARGQVGEVAGENGRARAGRAERGGEGLGVAVPEDGIFVEVQQRRLVHDPGRRAQDRLRLLVEHPREARPRGEVVLVLLEALREGVGPVRPRVGDAEKVVAHAVEQLEGGADAEVVLDEEPEEAGVVGDRGVAQVLLEAQIAEPVRPVLGCQVGGDVAERVDLPQRVDAVVVDELQVGARLETVAPAEPGEVVDHLPDLLVEIEAEALRAVQRRTEVRDAVHDDGRTGTGTVAGRPELVPPRELQPQLVEPVGAEGRDELHRHRVHAVVEVGRPLAGVEVAADVERRMVLEEEIAPGELVRRAQVVVRLGDEEADVLLGGDDGVRHRGGREAQGRRAVDRDGRDDLGGVAQVLVYVFITQVVVPLVPHEGAAQRGGEVVQVVVRLPGGGSEEKRPLREADAAVAVAHGALQGVGPRRRHRVVDHPRRLPELGSEAAGDDLDLTHDHFRDGQQAQARPVLLGVGVPVELEVRVHLRPVGVDAGDTELRVLVARDVGLQECEVVRVARDEGQVFHLGRGDDATERDLARIGDGGLTADRHHLLHAADLEREVQDRGLARAEADARPLHRLEAG